MVLFLFSKNSVDMFLLKTVWAVGADANPGLTTMSTVFCFYGLKSVKSGYFRK